MLGTVPAGWARASRRWMALRLVGLLGSGLLVAALVPMLGSTTAAAATCGQPTHVWIATPGGSLANGNTVTIPLGSIVYPTGVVTPDTNITFAVFDLTGANAGSFRTSAAGDNCVVAHEDAPFQIGGYPDTYVVTASFQQWETGQWVNQYVGRIVTQ